MARLLFLSANASVTSPLAVDREYNRVMTALQGLGVWPAWHDAIEHVPAVAWEQVAAQLLSHAPSIVHFAGHGHPDGSLEFSTPSGAGEWIGVAGLARLFEAYAGQVRLVVLNACYSDALATALTARVDAVIGVPRTIDDDSAILFAPTLYQQLAGGQSVQTAYEVARALLLGRAPGGRANRDVESPSGEPLGDGLPQLRVRSGVDASQMRFTVAAEPDEAGVTAAATGAATVAAESDAPAVGGAPRAAVKPGVLMLLAGLLVAGGVGVAAWSQVFRAQLGVASVLIVGLFALFSAAVLAGVLGATGTVKTATQQVSGAAAIFVVVLGAAVAGARQLAPSPSVLRLRVIGLADGERAQVTLVGGCSDTAVGPTGVLQLPLAGPCDSDPLHILIAIAGQEIVAREVRRADAADGQLIELVITRRPTEPEISGTVYTAAGTLLRDGRVTLAGCPQARPADIDANNGGFVLHIPAVCGDLRPPYTLVIRDATGESQVAAPDHTANQLHLRGRGGPGVPPPTEVCHIDRDYWAKRPCARVVSSSPPDADELRRLRAAFPRCGSFILDKCAPE